MRSTEVTARTVALLGVVVLGGCPPKSVAPPEVTPPPPPPVQVPPGCEANLSGPYRHQEHPSFRYVAEDDGGTLTLSVMRPAPGGPWPDAGVGRAGESDVEIILRRTPRGFVGNATALAFGASGQPCRVEFPTEVVACGDAGLTVRSAVSTSIDERCALPSARSPAPMVEHVLVPEPAPELDVDGGPGDGG